MPGPGPEVETHLRRWALVADGPLTTTRSSWVLPVRTASCPAMLKVARTPDERHGYGLMRWWNGNGAARIFASAPDALLLERAEGSRALADMARRGEDDQASRILCDTAATLHAGRAAPHPDLHRLDDWFAPLFDLGDRCSRLAPSAAIARRLLAHPREVVPLHGDLHHENVLDFGARGWLAIDPHGLLGERTFDYANIFTNPDLSDAYPPVAVLPGRLEARLAVVTRAGRLEPIRMLQWIAAWTALSAAWFIGDGDGEGRGAAIDLAINERALALLGD